MSFRSPRSLVLTGVLPRRRSARTVPACASGSCRGLAGTSPPMSPGTASPPRPRVSVFLFRPAVASSRSPVRDVIARYTVPGRAPHRRRRVRPRVIPGPPRPAPLRGAVEHPQGPPLEPRLDGLATTRTHMVENMLRFGPARSLLFVLGMPVEGRRRLRPSGAYGVSTTATCGVEPVDRALLVTPRCTAVTTSLRPRRTTTAASSPFGIGSGARSSAPKPAEERYGVPCEIDTYPQRFSDAFRQPLQRGSGSTDCVEVRTEDTREGERAARVHWLVPALVAQWIEHLTTDQKVGGSSPSSAAG